MKRYDIWKKISQGIGDQREAFCGPHTVQLDLTDKCNNTCIGCWIHSPFVECKEEKSQEAKELPFELVEELIYELHEMGTQEIMLSGSGEPFMYPRIGDVIKLSKAKGMYINVITNGTLIDEQAAEVLVKSGADLVTVSVWAGSAQSYIATHPGKTEADFNRLKDNLKTIARLKKKYNSLRPFVKIYNVICSENYKDMEAMVDFAIEADVNCIEFQVIDIIEGKTEHLALTEEAKKTIVKFFHTIINRKDFIKFDLLSTADFVKFLNKETDFGKIWKNHREEFTLLNRVANLQCRKQYYCVKGEGCQVGVTPLLSQSVLFRFYFDTATCRSCEFFEKCFPEQDCIISVEVLNMLGLNSFLRRVTSEEVEAGIYEGHINVLPCYIGWYYVRLLTNGDVIPCCKAYLHPMGNIFKKPFSEIWQSSSYREFRFKAKNYLKNNQYFSRINCIKSCDNWGMNLAIDERFKKIKNDI